MSELKSRLSQSSVSLIITMIAFIVVSMKRPDLKVLVLLFGIACSIVESGLTLISIQQEQLNERFYNIQDAKMCPEYVSYMSYAQINLTTYPFAIAAGAGMAIISGLVLLMVRKQFGGLTNESIAAASTLAGILCFTLTYKVLNCLSSRYCARDSCSAPLFHTS